MQLIIMDVSWVRSRTVTLSGAVLALASVLIGLFLAVAGVALYQLAAGPQGFFKGPERASDNFPVAAQSDAQRELFMRQNVDAMARKVGEIQARMVQMESLSERVSAMAGVVMPGAADKKTGKAPGQGGLLVGNRPLSMLELQDTLNQLDRISGQRTDLLTVLESRLMDQRLSKHMIPTQAPVPGHVVGSGFGWRIDPITGGAALHTGLDFATPVGTSILAAAGGIVVTQEFHPAYGNMVEIDHGNQVVTRYAHSSRVLVARGDVVRRGQEIAKVGTTGRSTGPHLHFEVWVEGVLQDPGKFLAMGDAAAKLAKAASSNAARGGGSSLAAAQR